MKFAYKKTLKVRSGYTCRINEDSDSSGGLENRLIIEVSPLNIMFACIKNVL